MNNRGADQIAQMHRLICVLVRIWRKQVFLWRGSYVKPPFVPYIVFANIEGSGKTAQMQRPALAYAVHLYDKYLFRIVRLKSLMRITGEAK